MSQSRLFLSVKQSCDDALRWVDDRLKTAGMLTLHTFDYKISQSSRGECSCPLHGMDDCTCQVVFLLIYPGQNQMRNGKADAPLSLMMHSHDGQTWIYIVDTPQVRADPRLEANVRSILIPTTQDTVSNSLSHTG